VFTENDDRTITMFSVECIPECSSLDSQKWPHGDG